MEIRYCDVCGGLVSAADAPAGPEDVGILCEVCLRTRRVLPDVVDAAARSEARRATKLQRFRCPHCERRLRTKAVRARVEIACPKCDGMLVLLPGGGVEALVPARPAKAEQNLYRTSTSSRRSAERARAAPAARARPPSPPEPAEDGAAALADEPDAVEDAATSPAEEEEAQPVEAAALDGDAEPAPEDENVDDEAAEEENGEDEAAHEESAGDDEAGDDEPAEDEAGDDGSADDGDGAGFESSEGEPATAPFEAIGDSDDAYGAAPGESGEAEEGDLALAFDVAAPARTSRPLLVLALAMILAGVGGAFAARAPDTPAAAQLEALGGRVGSAFAAIEERIADPRGRAAAEPAEGDAAPPDGR